MAKLLDFNKHRPPVLPLLLPDGTRVSVTPPTVNLQEELRANLDQLRALLTRDDEETVQALYDLAARLMGCNRNMLTFTTDRLREHGMEEDDLTLFFEAYTGFLREIENAKN